MSMHTTPWPLHAMARRLRVPASWLRTEAKAGRVPHLRAGRALLFDPETVERVVVERMRQLPAPRRGVAGA